MFRIYLYIQTFRWQPYGTLRCVIDAEQARVTHAVRSDVKAVRYPPTGDKKKIKKKKIEPNLNSIDEHSEV